MNYNQQEKTLKQYIVIIIQPNQKMWKRYFNFQTEVFTE